MYFDHNCNIKFLLSLRNTIERTVSQYQIRAKMQIDKGLRQDFFDINKDITKDKSYVKRSYIFFMLENYLKLFPKKNFFIFPIEKVNQNPKKWINKIFSFLDIQNKEDLNFEKPSSTNRNIKENIKFVDKRETKKNRSWCLEDIKKLSDLSGLDLIEFWNLKIGLINNSIVNFLYSYKLSFNIC